MIRIGVALLTLMILFQVHQQEMEGLEKRDRGEIADSNLELAAGKSWGMGALIFLLYGLIVGRFWVPLGVGAACALLDYSTFVVLRRMRSITLVTAWTGLHLIIFVILIPFELAAALWAGALNAWKAAKKP